MNIAYFPADKVSENGPKLVRMESVKYCGPGPASVTEIRVRLGGLLTRWVDRREGDEKLGVDKSGNQELRTYLQRQTYAGVQGGGG